MRVAAPLLVGLLCCAGTALAQPLPVGDPAALGFSTERLQRLDTLMRSATGPDGYLGGVSLVLRHGRVSYWRSFGHQDLARSRPMARDSIFRIYSMSKTIVTVAALMLMEEGRLALDDPIARHLPQFAGMQFFAGGMADAPMLRAPVRPITVRHLLTHTAGFATGGKGIEQASLLLHRAAPQEAADLKGFAARVASVPLAADPGERFGYDGVQIEVLGRLLEVASGQALEALLQARIFDPLKMVDSGFQVPPAQRHRVVDISAMDAQGRLVLAAGPSAVQPGAALNRYASGAGGLYSTASDFARFSQMLLGAGTLDGVTLLSRKSVDSMMSNQLERLGPSQGAPAPRFSPSEGFGLGGSVLLDPGLRGRVGSPGAFGWSGAASTYFTIDPQEQLVAILLLQHLHGDRPPGTPADLPKLSLPFYNAVYQALVR